jgi:hypothetical protein
MEGSEDVGEELKEGRRDEERRVEKKRRKRKREKEGN